MRRLQHVLERLDPSGDNKREEDSYNAELLEKNLNIPNVNTVIHYKGREGYVGNSRMLSINKK